MAELGTQRLQPDAAGLSSAAAILRGGGLVAFPTETVYGLGADACDDHAVARIYAAKGRPSFNPLIVHLPSVAAVKELVEWNDAAERAAQAFWPGPLTLVLPLKPDAGVSKLVTAGLDTLAVRVPSATVAHNLLTEFDGPVAAPSANTSGQISPTRAEHVLGDLSGKIDAVLDGGACAVGLESTILGLAGTPTLLRPGGVTLDQLTQVLAAPVTIRDDAAEISAPGQIKSHYAPRARVRLNATSWASGEARLGFGEVDCDLNLSATADLTQAAANLFEFLHRLDAGHAKIIAVSPIPNTGMGAAINDRLNRAAADR
ncbi:L-threonylcarbamoyladenylate synthase [Pelagimonas varians]|uniref:Threonylcarbamoyl-AMP synthase n=1 Tax=Pelagimonas varians TaxID=696760 RepID=A0A238L1F1_9RHOB|nr:L-threonylcarbamoyladenylate synthase [Pelagimonas varians]PYG26865.1 L-threonylcarbamoyladenylate synthase [Pelagimonas varians]SMX48915.1 Threonylcarbamoyl-AMP synthase [Pelagimonas varians]